MNYVELSELKVETAFNSYFLIIITSNFQWIIFKLLHFCSKSSLLLNQAGFAIFYQQLKAQTYLESSFSIQIFSIAINTNGRTFDNQMIAIDLQLGKTTNILRNFSTY